MCGSSASTLALKSASGLRILPSSAMVDEAEVRVRDLRLWAFIFRWPRQLLGPGRFGNFTPNWRPMCRFGRLDDRPWRQSSLAGGQRCEHESSHLDQDQTAIWDFALFGSVRIGQLPSIALNNFISSVGRLRFCNASHESHEISLPNVGRRRLRSARSRAIILFSLLYVTRLSLQRE